MPPNLVQASVASAVVDDEMERLARFARAWQHYEETAPKALDLSPDGSDDNIQVFSAETIVDKGEAFLFADDAGVQLQTDEPAAVGKISEVWPQAERAVQLHNLAVNGGVTGHVFVRLRLDGRVIVLDPSNVFPEWDQNDIETVNRWRIQWTTLEESSRLPVVYRQLIEPDGDQWTITDEKSIDQGRTWEQIGEVEKWPFPWAPILHGQNRPSPNQFWGRPDLTPGVLDLTEALWVLLGYMRRLVRHSGHPIPTATGVNADALKRLELSIGNMLTAPDAAARFGQLESAGDLGAALELYREVKDAWREQTAMPAVAAGKLDNVGQLSGFALQILYGPLMERTKTKRSTYGPLVAEIASRLLELNDVGENIVVTPVWSNPLPEDTQAETSAMEAEQRMGIVSKQTLAEKRGLDWETEQARLAEEREADVRSFDAL